MNLYQKINKVMLEVTSVEKNATISMGGNSYSAVTHDDVTRLLHIPVAKNGIVLVPTVVQSHNETVTKVDKYGNNKQEQVAHVLVRVTAINADKPEEQLFVEMPAIAFDASDKAFGKSISMATKYAYLKLFMLDSFDEEEARPEHNYTQKKSYKESAQVEGDLIVKIKSELTRLTAGKSAGEKASFLAQKLNVSSFAELNKMNSKQLESKLTLLGSLK
jgi:hypothetical protein